MSRSNYVWVVTGYASHLPVATFTTKYELVRWLESRQGTSMLRLFRFHGATFKIEVSIDKLLEDPKKAIQEVERD